MSTSASDIEHLLRQKEQIQRLEREMAALRAENFRIQADLDKKSNAVPDEAILGVSLVHSQPKTSPQQFIDTFHRFSNVSQLKYLAHRPPFQRVCLAFGNEHSISDAVMLPGDILAILTSKNELYRCDFSTETPTIAPPVSPEDGACVLKRLLALTDGTLALASDTQLFILTSQNVFSKPLNLQLGKAWVSLAEGHFAIANHSVGGTIISVNQADTFTFVPLQGIDKQQLLTLTTPVRHKDSEGNTSAYLLGHTATNNVIHLWDRNGTYLYFIDLKMSDLEMSIDHLIPLSGTAHGYFAAVSHTMNICVFHTSLSVSPKYFNLFEPDCAFRSKPDQTPEEEFILNTVAFSPEGEGIFCGSNGIMGHFKLPFHTETTESTQPLTVSDLQLFERNITSSTAPMFLQDSRFVLPTGVQLSLWIPLPPKTLQLDLPWRHSFQQHAIIATAETDASKLYLIWRPLPGSTQERQGPEESFKVFFLNDLNNLLQIPAGRRLGIRTIPDGLEMDCSNSRIRQKVFHMLQAIIKPDPAKISAGPGLFATYRARESVTAPSVSLTPTASSSNSC